MPKSVEPCHLSPWFHCESVASTTGRSVQPQKLALPRSDQDATPEPLGASARFIPIGCIARSRAATCRCRACGPAAPLVLDPVGSRPPHKLALPRSHQEAPPQLASARLHANLLDRIKRPHCPLVRLHYAFTGAQDASSQAAGVFARKGAHSRALDIQSNRSRQRRYRQQ